MDLAMKIKSFDYRKKNEAIFTLKIKNLFVLCDNPLEHQCQ